MATLEKIRNRAGLLVAIIGIALFSFIIGDFLNSGSTFFRQAKDKVVVVNGKSFSSREFQDRIEELTSVYKMETGQSSLPEEYVANIRESVYEGLVREQLINEQAEKAGLSVSTAELLDMIQGEHISPMIQRLRMFANPNTGVFDRTMLLNFLKAINDESGKYTGEQAQQIAELKKYWAYWQKTIKQQRLEEKYSMLLGKAVAPNSIEAKSAFDGAAKSVDFTYTVQPYFTIPDSTIEVSKSELTALYEKRKENFKQNETRSVKYIAISIKPSAEDIKEAEAKINAVKAEFVSTANVADVVNENSDAQYVDAYIAVRSLPATVKAFAANGQVGDVYGPALENNVYQMHRIIAKSTSADSIKARHILIPTGQDEAKSSKLADSILVALKGGSNFEALSAQFSAAQNAKQGGDFGWFNEEAAVRGMGAEFKDACFNTPVNGYAKVKTMYGFDIVQVTQKTNAVSKVKLASIINEVIASKKTTGSIYSALSQFVIKNNTTSKFVESAAKENYNVLSNPAVNTNDYVLGDVRNARQVIHWIFNEASKGSVSNIYEIGNNTLVVAAVENVTKKGYTPLENVQDRLKAEILVDKKAEKIIADLKAKNITTLDGYAKVMSGRLDTAKFVSFSTSRITNLGDEPTLCGVAPYSAKGKVTGPLKGKSGVYVLAVTNETTSNRPYDAKTEINNLRGNYMYRIMYQMMETLKKSADIEDNRVRFY